MSNKGLELINKLAEMKDDMVIDMIICSAIEEGIDVEISGLDDDYDKIEMSIG